MSDSPATTQAGIHPPLRQLKLEQTTAGCPILRMEEQAIQESWALVCSYFCWSLELRFSSRSSLA